jgi:alkylhydroperoxidase/carboxymuconolactone decarboxylase family protein YurZ
MLAALGGCEPQLAGHVAANLAVGNDRQVLINTITQLHWHGATPTTSMTHIAIQEALEGKNVNWLQKVTDEEYLSGPQRQNGK